MKIGNVINFLAKDNIQPVATIENEPKWEWIDGWKVVRPDMRAMVNDFQFECGGTYEIEPKESIVFGETGFHFYESKKYINYDFSEGYRVFKVKALVREDRTHHSGTKQVAAKIIFGDELSFKEYQSIFGITPFVKDEESYQHFLECMKVMAYNNYIMMMASEKLASKTGLTQGFCLILAENLKRKLVNQGGLPFKFEDEIENIITIYNEPALSKEMATYFMIKRTLD